MGDVWRFNDPNTDIRALAHFNLGPLSAIGEQKATQFFAQLANGFDPKAGAAYEAIFSAWGGDVKERSVDLKSGKVRPREIDITADDLKKDANVAYRVKETDPTVYARVDYLDEKAKITDAEKASCRNILKNLPVVFTFAPMNLVHYQPKFPAKSNKVLTVTYKQYAYKDTADPASYQLAYVVHPASFWKDFGPINLAVSVPQGVALTASVDCKKAAAAAPAANVAEPAPGPASGPMDTYCTVLKEKTGEIFLAVDAAGWDKMAATPVAGPTAGK
jgi:hypothetical protein